MAAPTTSQKDFPLTFSFPNLFDREFLIGDHVTSIVAATVGDLHITMTLYPEGVDEEAQEHVSCLIIIDTVGTGKAHPV